jgi:hypothetical protein
MPTAHDWQDLDLPVLLLEHIPARELNGRPGQRLGGGHRDFPGRPDRRPTAPPGEVVGGVVRRARLHRDEAPIAARRSVTTHLAVAPRLDWSSRRRRRITKRDRHGRTSAVDRVTAGARSRTRWPGHGYWSEARRHQPGEAASPGDRPKSVTSGVDFLRPHDYYRAVAEIARRLAWHRWASAAR